LSFVVKKKPSTLKAARLIDSAKFLFAPATAVTVMTVLKLPVSTSHAVIRHIVGVERMQKHVARTGIDKIFVCRIGTQTGGCVFSEIKVASREQVPVIGSCFHLIRSGS